MKRTLFWRYSRLAGYKTYGPHDRLWRLVQYLPRLWWGLRWDPRDVWVGVFWERYFDDELNWRHALDVYVCVLPCLPLKFQWRWAGLDPWRLRDDDIPF